MRKEGESGITIYIIERRRKRGGGERKLAWFLVGGLKLSLQQLIMRNDSKESSNPSTSGEGKRRRGRALAGQGEEGGQSLRRSDLSSLTSEGMGASSINFQGERRRRSNE